MKSALFKSDRPATSLTATLHHLSIESEDPERLANFYHQALGYEVFTCGGILAGRAEDRYITFHKGRSKTLAGAGYVLPNTDELGRLRQRINAVGWPSLDGPTTLFTDAVSVRDPDGTNFSFGIAEELPSSIAIDSFAPARIQHAVMASREPDKIVGFFTEVLGFTLSDNVVDPEGGIRTSFLRCSEEHHSFAVFKADENRFDHHCYETRDWNSIRDWSDSLASQHIPIKWGPGRHGPGNNLFIFIHDPDGNWIELSAELEVVSHERPLGSWPHEERTLNSWGHGLLRS